jgi:hypothetical protein
MAGGPAMNLGAPLMRGFIAHGWDNYQPNQAASFVLFFRAAFAAPTGCSASITATGFFAITVRNARAEASGVRRPPSQCFTASRLKPNV